MTGRLPNEDNLELSASRPMPRDRFGREINYLRLSLIDHCNLRCVYCMPLRGLSFVPGEELLTAEELERLIAEEVVY